MNALRKAAAPPPLADQIHDLTEQTIACRDMRHAWAMDVPYYRIEVEGGVRGAIYVQRTLGCMRGCGCTRLELSRVYKDRVERLTSRLIYPKGYVLKGVGKAKVQQMVRREEVRRVLGDL
jgi:hypothetical protein